MIDLGVYASPLMGREVWCVILVGWVSSLCSLRVQNMVVQCEFVWGGTSILEDREVLPAQDQHTNTG